MVLFSSRFLQTHAIVGALTFSNASIRVEYVIVSNLDNRTRVDANQASGESVTKSE